MDVSQHMGAVPELDLSASCHPSTIVDRISAVPGLKPSAAFFTFLRANLVLPHSAMSSNVSTPYLEPHSSTLAPPSPSPLATNPPLAALDDIPPLTLDVLTTHDDKVDALRLVADSIAEQRQEASFNLATHPVPLGTLGVCLGGVYQYAWIQRDHDLGTALILATGLIMTYLMAVRYFASGYIQAAEALRWDWLLSDDGEEDVILGTRFGQNLIGALVLRLEPNSTLAGKKKNKSLSLKGGKGVIRAWTTKMKYRGQGVGPDLLREAVLVTREKCGKDAEIGFAKEHANSTMVLPEMFNGAFRRQEMQAARSLEEVVASIDKEKRKR